MTAPTFPIYVCARCGQRYTRADPWTAWGHVLCHSCWSDLPGHGKFTNIAHLARAWLENEIILGQVWRDAYRRDCPEVPRNKHP